MFISVNKLANQLPKDKPDNLAANALQEGLGGQFGEMRTMMQYLFQNFNFKEEGKALSRSYKERCFRRDRPRRVNFYYNRNATGRILRMQNLQINCH